MLSCYTPHYQETCCVYSAFQSKPCGNACAATKLLCQYHSTLSSLQVHYLQARPPGDHSGITLRMTRQSTPFSAGMINYAKYFTIPPGKPQHPIENQCCYSGFEILKGFAFRVHTHALGRSAVLPCPAMSCPSQPCPVLVHDEGLQAERADRFSLGSRLMSSGSRTQHVLSQLHTALGATRAVYCC